MEFNQIDKLLFEHACKVMHLNGCTKDERTAYTKEAKLVWAGKHYLLIRSGTFEGKKEAEIWSRETLLLGRGNVEKNPMQEIALATIPLVHKNWPDNFRRTLWRQGSITRIADGKFSRRRWNNALVQDLVEFCEEEDRLLPGREAAAIARLDDQHTFSQSACKLMQDHGFRIKGTIMIDDIPFPVGHKFRVTMRDGSGLRQDEFRFKPTKKREIEVELTNQTFDFDEFEILAEALVKISKKRKEAKS